MIGRVLLAYLRLQHRHPIAACCLCFGVWGGIITALLAAIIVAR